MAVDVLLGLQWGDEGKGKIVDVIGHQYDVVARFQGGPNAGHTLVVEGKKYVLKQIPSGIFHPQTVCLIGNGVVLNPVILKEELQSLHAAGLDIRQRLLLSRRMHIILPTHRLLDKAAELAKGDQKIGSTLRGIGPTYQDKMARAGIRLGDIEAFDFKDRYNFAKAHHLKLVELYGMQPADYAADLKDWEALFWDSLPTLKSLTALDSEYYLHKVCTEGKRVLAEGAQGALLDVDFGSYPFVTSSNTTTGGACSGLGLAPRMMGIVFGVFKAYCTRVGSGPFPTELHGDEAERLRVAGNEYGAVTGRPRRIGWLDLPALKYACMLNGVHQLVMTKADVLSGMAAIRVCTAYRYGGKTTETVPFFANEAVEPIYQDQKGWTVDPDHAEVLPKELSNYIQFLEDNLKLPVRYVSLGADRKYIVDRAIAAV